MGGSPPLAYKGIPSEIYAVILRSELQEMNNLILVLDRHIHLVEGFIHLVIDIDLIGLRACLDASYNA